MRKRSKTTRPKRSPPRPPAKTQAIRDAIHSNSREVDLRQLAERQKVGRVVTMATLERIMTEAVENVLLQGPADPLLDAATLRDQTRQEFRKLLESHQQALHEKSEAERARESLDRQVQALKRELETQQAKLASELQRSALEVHLSADALDEVEARVNRILGGGETQGRRAGLSEVEQKLQEVFGSLLKQERERVARSYQASHNEEVQRLEQRISKLGNALEKAEESLHEVAHAAPQPDQGIASKYSAPKGLAANARNYGRKKELLQVVFVNNLRLRKREVRPDDLEGVPEDLLLKDPKTAESAAPVEPVGKAKESGRSFVAPVDSLTDDCAF